MGGRPYFENGSAGFVPSQVIGGPQALVIDLRMADPGFS